MSDDHARLVSAALTEVRTQVERRLTLRLRKENAATDDGAQVWLSLHMRNAQFKHWSILIEDSKYELRAVSKKGQTQLIDDDTNGHPIDVGPVAASKSWPRVGSRRYGPNIQPLSAPIDVQKRNASVQSIGIPLVDGYLLCLIGWTKFSRAELEKRCNKSLSETNRYNLFFDNCQHFLRRFANSIVTTKGPDWDWFYHSTSRSYCYVDPMDDTSAAIFGKLELARVCLERLRTLAANPDLPEGERASLRSKIAMLESWYERLLAVTAQRQAAQRYERSMRETAIVSSMHASAQRRTHNSHRTHHHHQGMDSSFIAMQNNQMPPMMR